MLSWRKTSGVMDDTLLAPSALVSLSELLTANRQLQSELARLSARLDQVEAENCELRRDVSELKCEVGYWKSRHADALQRIQERDLVIEQQQAEIKQLKSRQFGRKTEKSSGTCVFVDLLLSKYQVHQPVERWLLEWRQNDLDLAKGTVFDGLCRIEPMLHPIHQAILERAAAAGYSQADESRWLMFAEVAGKTGHLWWMWAFLSADAIGYRLDPTRSHNVPQRHFASDAKAVLMVDRYSAYKAMDQVKQGHIVLAFCWAHVRRDFVEVGKGSEQLVPWALAWLQRIRDLSRCHRLRQQHSDNLAGEPLAAMEIELRQILSDMQAQATTELAQGPSLREPCRKVLVSLQAHWEGLTRFVDDLRIPLDNNRSERAMRSVALGRKNYSGSTSSWSGILAAAMFSIIATLSLHGLNPRKWLTWYLNACPSGQIPSDVSPYLPWNLTPDQRAELSLRPPNTS